MITAPFNFVPLNDKVFFPDWAEKINHDIPFEDGESGLIDITIIAKSPIFVRNHYQDGDRFYEIERKDKKLQKMIDERGLSDKVIVLGFKKNPYPYIKNAKLLVSSSNSEGLPRSIVEALILHTPVVTTYSSKGIDEVMIDELQNFIVPKNQQDKLANKILDIRVSVLPTFYGERVVMRILMQADAIPKMQELGFQQSLIKEFDKLLKHSHGIILVTGPTGSGKSTTLHSFLQTIASPEKNIITIEDPVEYKADNINQIQVNNKVGLNFSTGLRTILRQDPDIIMVGEIRDKETATIAIQAALTGHLVLSTLHTNNAPATITRLMDMGIKPFLISSSLIGILAQRLVRILCEECKEIDTSSEI